MRYCITLCHWFHQNEVVPTHSGHLERHFEQKPLVIAERFCFHHRGQSPGESVANFDAEL